MNYSDEFLKAKEDGKAEEVTSSIYKFEEEGQDLIGKVVAIEEFTEGDFETDVNKYVLETDIGRVSCVLGSATDKQLTGAELLGKLICITFRGKASLKDGKQVNRFQIEVV